MAKQKNYDVVVLGAGTAGLTAVAEIKKVTDNFLLINKGEYGTTCARVGCMPSKALIQTANNFHNRARLNIEGVKGAENLKIDPVLIMRHVRKLRDRFVRGVVKETESLGAKSIRGDAHFIDSQVLQVGEKIIKTKSTIIATGTTPKIPASWKRYADHILTTDLIFELDCLPKSMITVGLGPLGLELGQAFSRLGVKVVGIGSSNTLANLTDPVVIEFAKKTLSAEFPLYTGDEAMLSKSGKHLKISTRKKTFTAEKVLASLGRDPNLKSLGLEDIGVRLDKRGLPLFDPHSMKIDNFPIFIAGDVSQYRPVLHEAGDEGRISGYNSVRKQVSRFERKVPINITFTDPNIVTVGKSFGSLKTEKIIIGESVFDFGRAIILGETGIIRIYAQPKTGLLLGAEMVIPSGEHLAHLLATMIQNKMTVFSALKVPYYHPTIEEAFQDALKNLSKKIIVRRNMFLSPLKEHSN